MSRSSSLMKDMFTLENAICLIIIALLLTIVIRKCKKNGGQEGYRNSYSRFTTEEENMQDYSMPNQLEGGSSINNGLNMKLEGDVDGLKLYEVEMEGEKALKGNVDFPESNIDGLARYNLEMKGGD